MRRVGEAGEVRWGWGHYKCQAEKLKFNSVGNRELRKVLRREVNWPKTVF